MTLKFVVFHVEHVLGDNFDRFAELFLRRLIYKYVYIYTDRLGFHLNGKQF